VQDGIAAGGLPAIFLMSIVGAAVFWIFDTMTAWVPPRFAFISVAVIAIAFANTPLSTTLVTGGMALLAALLYFAPRIVDGRHTERTGSDGIH
jgi:hypothetical protein